MKKVYAHFRDTLIYDGKEKTAVSVRDGVLEYLGAEIGYEPADKVFKVYRSPATIANAAQLMRGIPVTNDHVDLSRPVDESKGEVLTSRMIDLDMPVEKARIGVLNTLRIDGDLQAYLDAGKRELSLGYNAALIPAPMESDFDLEQIEILPHHLAVVNAGRCGSVCSFIDHSKTEGSTDMTKKTDKDKKLHKAFTDEGGAPSLTEIVAIAQSLPEALKTLPADKLMEVMPMLQEIVAMSGATAPAETTGDEDPAAKTEETTDEGGEEKPLSQAVTDSKAFKDAVAAAAKKVKITDSKEFADAVAAETKKQTAAAIAKHVAVMDKARQFLPEDFKYEGKTTAQVMKEAVATEHGKQEFSDSELEVAFKMLKVKPSSYKNFGDAKTGKFTALADKEL